MVAFGDGAARLHLETLVGDVVVAVRQLAVLDVEDEAPVVPTHREQDAFRTTLGNVGVYRYRVRYVDQMRRRIARHDLGARVVDVLLAIDRDLRPFLGETRGAA